MQLRYDKYTNVFESNIVMREMDERRDESTGNTTTYCCTYMHNTYHHIVCILDDLLRSSIRPNHEEIEQGCDFQFFVKAVLMRL